MPKRALTLDQARELRAYLLEGHTKAQATRRFGVSQSTVERIARGRRPYASLSDIGPLPTHRPKVSETEAREIRERVAAGQSQRDVARAFGVSHVLVGHVVHGRGVYAYLEDLGDFSDQRLLTDRQAIELRRLRLAGWTIEALADRYGVSEAVADNVVHGRCAYAHFGDLAPARDLRELLRPALGLLPDQILARIADCSESGVRDMRVALGLISHRERQHRLVAALVRCAHLSNSEIAALVGVDASTVWAARQGVTSTRS